MAHQTTIFNERGLKITDTYYETTGSRCINFETPDDFGDVELSIKGVERLIAALQKAVDVPTVSHSGKTFIFPELTKEMIATVDVQQGKSLILTLSGLHYGDPISLWITEAEYEPDGDEYGVYYTFGYSCVWADDGTAVDDDVRETYDEAIQETLKPMV